MSMTFETKIAIVLRGDLLTWQKLNVTAFISGALAGRYPEIIGENYVDASDNVYLPMVIQPIMVFQATAGEMRKAYNRATSRGIEMAIYTEELFSTGNDIDNRAAVRAVEAKELNLVGVALRGERKAVDKVIKGLKLQS